MLQNLEVTKRLFAARGHHSLLWPNNTAFARSQRGYFGTKDVIIEDHQKVIYAKVGTVCCSQRPQHLRVTEGLFADKSHQILLWTEAIILLRLSRGYL